MMILLMMMPKTAMELSLNNNDLDTQQIPAYLII